MFKSPVTSQDNKLILKNTLIVYVRMILVMVLGIISSRFVLQALGVSDFGLYNVVGGLIAMLNFISTAMSTTTRRYLNVEMGRSNSNLNEVFNVSINLHLGFAVFILLIAETVGIWYIINVLNVAPGKEQDAMFVFQVSTIVACMGILNIPYQGLIEAHEKFYVEAVIDVLCSVFKFALVIVLIYYQGNSLRFYAISVCVVTAISFVAYHYYCHKEWPSIIKIRRYRKSPLYREMLSFNGYTALGAAASIGKTQGSNLLVNYFFGTIVNGAFAVAFQVESCVYLFVNRLTLAANPQIAKNFSSGDLNRVGFLVENNTRYSVLIMMLMYFPLVVEVDFILKIWLGTVPEGAVLLCFLTLTDALVKSLCEGTNGLIQASGKIKYFQILSSFSLIINLPLAYFLFKIGLDAYWIIVCFIATSLFYRVISLSLMKRLLHFEVFSFCKRAYGPPFLVFVLMLFLSLLIRSLSVSSATLCFLLILFTLVVDGILVFFIGINKRERDLILGYLKK